MTAPQRIRGRYSPGSAPVPSAPACAPTVAPGVTADRGSLSVQQQEAQIDFKMRRSRGGWSWIKVGVTRGHAHVVFELGVGSASLLINRLTALRDELALLVEAAEAERAGLSLDSERQCIGIKAKTLAKDGE